MRALWKSRGGRVAAVAVLALTAAVLAGLVVLWPSGGTTPQQPRPHDHEARVVAVHSVACPTPHQRHCSRADARFTAGPERGRIGTFDASTAGASAAVGVGDKVLLAANGLPSGQPVDGIAPYSLTGYQRHGPLLVLACVFVAFVVLLGRGRGVMALVGLAISLLIVVKFVVPAILAGDSPILVAAVGALAVMIVTIVLCHGAGAQSVAAILGTTISLAVAMALAATFIAMTNVTGVASDESQLVLAGRADLSLDGLILAGMIIGALGVLDDLTVSQASTVMALRRAAPGKRARALYREALEVGRDHVAATVNTLVLAYVGAALPILLIFAVGGTGFGDAVNIEQVTQQIVATLVGSIGLIVAVPVTTALAALLAVSLPPADLREHGHSHGTPTPAAERARERIRRRELAHDRSAG